MGNYNLALGLFGYEPLSIAVPKFCWCNFNQAWTILKRYQVELG